MEFNQHVSDGPGDKSHEKLENIVNESEMKTQHRKICGHTAYAALRERFISNACMVEERNAHKSTG